MVAHAAVDPLDHRGLVHAAALAEARRLGRVGTPDHDDLVQTAWIAVVRCAAAYRPELGLAFSTLCGKWLFHPGSLAQRARLDFGGRATDRHGRRPRIVPIGRPADDDRDGASPEPAVPDHAPSVDARLDHGVWAGRYLDSLDPVARAAAELRWDFETGETVRSQAEVASALGVSDKTAWAALGRATGDLPPLRPRGRARTYSPEAVARFRELHRRGLTDRRIAERMADVFGPVGGGRVSDLREKLGLPVNRSRRPAYPAAVRDGVRALHALGLCDREIMARMPGVFAHVRLICLLRYKLGRLPANPDPERSRRVRAARFGADDVRVITARIAAGEKLKDLAAEFGVPRPTLYGAIRRHAGQQAVAPQE